MSYVMPEIVDARSENEAMRARTGEVTDHRRLVAFLYLVVRDHVVPGAVEELLNDIAGVSGPFEFTNGHLARYAQDIAARLVDDDPDAALRNLADSYREDASRWAETGDRLQDEAATERAVETALTRAREERVPVYVRPGEGERLLRLRCGLCRAANPDVRRVLLEEHGQRQHCHNCRTVLEAPPETLPEDLPEPAGPDEEPCGAADRTGRLICTLPASHRQHEYGDAGDDEELCAEPEHEGSELRCVKPKGHMVHGAEGTL